MCHTNSLFFFSFIFLMLDVVDHWLKIASFSYVNRLKGRKVWSLSRWQSTINLINCRPARSRLWGSRASKNRFQPITAFVKLLTTKMIFLASTILHSLEIKSAHTLFTDIFRRCTVVKHSLKAWGKVVRDRNNDNGQIWLILNLYRMTKYHFSNHEGSQVEWKHGRKYQEMIDLQLPQGPSWRRKRRGLRCWSSKKALPLMPAMAGGKECSGDIFFEFFKTKERIPTLMNILFNQLCGLWRIG